MTERELNKKWLKEQIKGFAYSENTLDRILDLFSEEYKNGLHQGWFDKEMDMLQLQQENQLLKRNCNIGNENLSFYKQENQSLKDRIEKAIEWVKDWTHEPNNWFEVDTKPSDLLKILKGDK